MTHTAQGLLRVNGDIEDNIFVFASSLETIANGGAGEDYYLYRDGQQGRVTISDYSSSNRLYFGTDITITAANISKSQLRISFEGTEDMLRLRNFSSYRFFIDHDEDGLSHTEFLARANSDNGITVTTSVELPPSIITPASARTVEIRANGTVDVDTFSIGYDLRAEFNGGAGRDTFEITRYQTDDVVIRDFSVGNLIRFESGVGIANLEVNRGVFNINLDNGAVVSVIIGSLQEYQMGGGDVMTATEFRQLLAPPIELRLDDPVTTLAENADTSNSVKVADIVMIDPDGSGPRRLGLSGQDSELFELNEAQTGLLLKAGSILDFETNPSLDVTVFSVLTPSDSMASLRIAVTDVAPMVTAGQGFTVLETASEAAVIGTVVITGDMNSVTFEITEVDGMAYDADTAVFAIDTDTGIITLIAILDFETARSYTLTVAASDGTTTDTAEITVNVTNIDETPPSIDDAQASIAENAILGAEVIDINDANTSDDSDTDDANGQALQYRITAGNAGNAFVINQDSGAITVADSSSLDFETTTRYTLTVEANDGTTADTAEITVNVSDINEAPTTSGDEAFDVAEGGSYTLTAVDLSAEDEDAGDGAEQLTWTLITAPTSGGQLRVAGTTIASNATFTQQQLSDGAVVYVRNDNDEVGMVAGADSFIVQVADDEGAMATAQTIDVTVTPVDDAPTAVMLTGTTTTLAENRDTSSAITVANITVTDINGGPRGLELVGADAGLFTLNDGQTELLLRAGAELDFETNPVLDVTVRVAANQTVMADLSIMVRDVNEAPNIRNTIPPQVVLADEEITINLADFFSDPDAGDNLTYTASSNNENIVTAMIVDSTLTLAEVEGSGLVSITVTASDEAGLEIAQTFTVQVPAPPVPAIALSQIQMNINDDGFVINGVNAGDQSGFSVSGAGDINGDGWDDIIVGAFQAEPGNTTDDNRGASYVVFGKSDGVIVQLSDIDDADNLNGFVIDGVNAGDQSGISVSGAGDVNGDGLDDILIGARDTNGNSGASYVVFGKSDGSVVELGRIDNPSNINGFVINGVDMGDQSGFSLSGGGDINGDGLDDIIIGASGAEPDGIATDDNRGSSYVVFGKKGMGGS